MAFQDRVTAYLDDLSRYISRATVDSSDNGSLSLADGMERFIAMGREATASDRKMIMIGNGASATMASHFATDFSKEWRNQSVDSAGRGHADRSLQRCRPGGCVLEAGGVLRPGGGHPVGDQQFR